MIEKNSVIQNPYLIISVIGSHAGENITNIFFRKQQEIENTGKSYWLIQSRKAKTQQIQDLCKEAVTKKLSVYCLFIEPSQKGGAKPTSHNSKVISTSSDNKNWEKVPDGIKITGKISKNSTGLVFDELKIFNTPISFDLWKYSEFKTKNPIKIMLGASTVCCEQISSHGMKNHYRKIVGFGKLTYPYSLWLK